MVVLVAHDVAMWYKILYLGHISMHMYITLNAESLVMVISIDFFLAYLPLIVGG